MQKIVLKASKFFWRDDWVPFKFAFLLLGTSGKKVLGIMPATGCRFYGMGIWNELSSILVLTGVRKRLEETFEIFYLS